ncbi:nuclear transport factor 2 family protein [Litoreibacter roseus]|uniref:SnoaL-like domain-containing protein n=1 Tax=Litoreibacter roseus TaxID=2601869 RepID=A0A6N6JMF6_9RHOB|nr:nuclear transport factor 2 family protein [Litoreibacter roseus]GFE67070.1 hypothetical protein KIN_41440 [Litoreibacter roseus]
MSQHETDVSDPARPTRLKGTVQSFLAAAYGGKIEDAKRYLTDDLRLEIAGSSAVSGTRSGPDAFFENFGRMLELTEHTYTMTEQTDWCASLDRVVLVATEQTTKDGKPLTFRRAVIYRFRSELIDQISVYELDPDVAAAAFG